jgi:hypothetical protein
MYCRAILVLRDDMTFRPMTLDEWEALSEDVKNKIARIIGYLVQHRARIARPEEVQ